MVELDLFSLDPPAAYDETIDKAGFRYGNSGTGGLQGYTFTRAVCIPLRIYRASATMKARRTGTPAQRKSSPANRRLTDTHRSIRK